MSGCCESSVALPSTGYVDGMIIDDMGTGSVIPQADYGATIGGEVVTSPSMIQGSDVSVESSSDMGMAVEKPFDRAPSEPMIDDSVAEDSQPPQPAETTTPKEEEQAIVPAEGDLFGSDPIAPEPDPEPQPEPEPAVVEEPVVPAADDLFGSEPMGADETEPAAEPSNNLDDLFGTGDAPADATPPASESGLDDLFGSEPDAAEMTTPADAAGDASSSPSIDALFDEAPALPATDPMPADPTPPAVPAPADPPGDANPLDELFGDPPMEESAPGSAPESNESFDDLFGSPSSGNTPVDEDSLDDLFGTSPDAGDTDVKSESNLSIDDLFGQQLDAPRRDSEPMVAEEVVTFEAELPAPLVSVKKAANLQVVSATTEAAVDPLAKTRMRVWIDNTGGFRTKGRLIEIRPDSVRLLKSNGKTCTVPNGRLSEADAAYVSGVQARIDSTPLAMVTPR